MVEVVPDLLAVEEGEQEHEDDPEESPDELSRSDRDVGHLLDPNAHVAKILHYNGRHKPWKSDRQASSGKALCGPTLRLCAELWWNYVSPRAEYLLKALMDDHMAA